MTSLKRVCTDLEVKIQQAYTEGVTLDQAEKLAAEFLHAQLTVSAELSNADLDSRMRKTGVKAIKAAIYNEACSKAEKKPTESALEHIINLNELVQGEQNELDKAEVSKAELERYYDIFLNAHIYFRGVAKGKFD